MYFPWREWYQLHRDADSEPEAEPIWERTAFTESPSPARKSDGIVVRSKLAAHFEILEQRIRRRAISHREAAPSNK